MSRTNIGPKVRFSYAFVFAPNTRDKNPKYQADLLIHKSDTATLQALFAAYNEVLNQARADASFKVGPDHPNFKHVLKDGDLHKPNDHVYAGHWFLVARSTNRPEVVGPACEPLSNETQFYSGCYGNVTFEFKLYKPSAQVPDSGYGVRALLGNIQKVSDGERLSGGAPAANEFHQVGPPTAGGFAPVSAQPQQQFGAPAPQQQFGAPAPQQQFGAPAPQQQFGAPAPAQAPVQPQQGGWGQPAPQTMPQPGYGAPQQQQFGAPAPQQQFGAPAPQQQFGAPQGNPFAAPAQAQPQQQFGAPQGYGQPAPGVNPNAPQPPMPGQQPPQPSPWEGQRMPQ